MYLAMGLCEYGAVGGSAATADGAATAVEEAQGNAGVAGGFVEGAVGFEDFPGAGDHASVLVGVGVAEHDFLGMAPGVEEWLVSWARPEFAADGGGVLEVFDGLEEGDGLEARVWILLAGDTFGSFDPDSAEAGEADYVEDVFGGGGAGDDIAGEGLGGEGAL